MDMKEILQHDNTKLRADGSLYSTKENPKIALKTKIAEDKKRRAREMLDDEAAYAESTIKKSSARSNKSAVKRTATLRLGKEKPEITIAAKKV